ncbi:MAG: hypothetical protein P8P74_11650 [Crocinitomicaceae bacterium]|nr:hypothetical protein [Crocinitomicaceae bacterium]
MKWFITITLVVFATGFSLGQDFLASGSSLSQWECEAYVPRLHRQQGKPRSLYFELGGSGGFGSFNFEWTFATKNKFRWMLRTGISGTYIDKNNGAGFIFPVMVHGVYGHKHGLDVGIGQALTITTKGSFFLRAPVSIGYRLEPEGKRLFYRFSYTPIVSYIVDFQWEHWGGITIGYKLRPKLKERRR